MRPGNIYSGNSDLARFTNPTELAHKKGKLSKHYPVIIDSRTFEDAEAAYHFYTRDNKDDIDFCAAVCIRVLQHKLEQYPELVCAMESAGGLSWIEKCYHFTYAKTLRFRRWEGIGRKSLFIDCLYKAYEAVAKQEHK